MPQSIDITGKTFNNLTALNKAKIVKGKEHWLFKCICGKQITSDKSSVTRGLAKSCGCLKLKYPVNYVAEGSVLSFIKDTNKSCNKPDSKRIRQKALYKCKCGKEIEVFKESAQSGHTKSCGCLIGVNKVIKHGLSDHKFYGVWRGIRTRCKNKKSEDYPRYGAKGVFLCDEWENNPQSFFDWLEKNGYKKGMEVDKDIKKGMVYSPENCVVVTKAVNLEFKPSNRYIEYNGEIRSVSSWARVYNMNASTLSVRLDKGWSIEDAFNKPVKKNKK